MTIKEALIQARQTLSDPNAWTKGNFARDAKGQRANPHRATGDGGNGKHRAIHASAHDADAHRKPGEFEWADVTTKNAESTKDTMAQPRTLKPKRYKVTIRLSDEDNGVLGIKMNFSPPVKATGHQTAALAAGNEAMTAIVAFVEKHRAKQ